MLLLSADNVRMNCQDAPTDLITADWCKLLYNVLEEARNLNVQSLLGKRGYYTSIEYLDAPCRCLLYFTPKLVWEVLSSVWSVQSLVGQHPCYTNGTSPHSCSKVLYDRDSFNVWLFRMILIVLLDESFICMDFMLDGVILNNHKGGEIWMNGVQP